MIHNVHKAVLALGAGLLLTGVNAFGASEGHSVGILRPAPRTPVGLLGQAAEADNRPASAWGNEPYVPAATGSQREVRLAPKQKPVMPSKSIFSMEGIEANKFFVGSVAAGALAGVMRIGSWLLTPTITDTMTAAEITKSIDQKNGWLGTGFKLAAVAACATYAYDKMTADSKSVPEAKKDMLKGFGAGVAALSGLAYMCGLLNFSKAQVS
jgi:hypothetical protein